jgi:hypothetical protein
MKLNLSLWKFHSYSVLHEALKLSVTMMIVICALDVLENCVTVSRMMKSLCYLS